MEDEQSRQRFPVSPPLNPLYPHPEPEPAPESEHIALSLPAASPAGSIGSSDRFSHSHVSSPSDDNNTAKTPSPVVVAMRSVREEPKVVTKMDIGAEDGFAGGGEIGETAGRRSRRNFSIMRKSERENRLKKALLGFRLGGFLLCLVSFSVMAADRNQGWALDSFYHYKEFRYCISVNVIGFVYSGLQTCDLVYQLWSRKQITQPHLRYYLDFILDQIMAYLLMSSSSSAATRVEDWKSNWGKDKFPDMSSASVGISFVAYVALAVSSLFSGYILCFTLKSR